MNHVTLLDLLCALGLVWLLDYAWSKRPRATVTRYPARAKPTPRVCEDCGWRQDPSRTVCWICSGNMDRLHEPHTWV